MDIKVTIDGKQYEAQVISPTNTGGRHCIFYGTQWYVLVPIDVNKDAMEGLKTFNRSLEKAFK